MITGMRSRKASEAAEATLGRPKVLMVEALAKPVSGAKEAWTELLVNLKSDVKAFNGEKARAGHSAVLMSSEKQSIVRFQFEVYLPEMNSKLLVLTMSGNKLEVEVRPEFPRQKSAITVEAGKNGKGYRWVVAEFARDKEVTAANLSEYLLKPVLSSATID